MVTIVCLFILSLIFVAFALIGYANWLYERGERKALGGALCAIGTLGAISAIISIWLV